MSDDLPYQGDLIRDGKITPEDMTAIGRIIRGFAEIEDLLTHYISLLTTIKISALVVMLGDSGLSRKMQILLGLSKLVDPAHANAISKIFNTTFNDAQQLRNCLAHGSFMGVDEHNRYAFITKKKLEDPVEGSAIMIVKLYSSSELQRAADLIERNVEAFESGAKLAPSRKMLRKGILTDHPKEHAKKAKTATPPRSFPA
jgi:hypothetical protein